MKLYIFGSCSGTEPVENRHHTAFAVELNGRIYWFDAGENCSYTAHLMGVDLLSVSDVFISHPHMDHVGGLGNLLWNIRKLSTMTKVLPRYGDITLYMPNEDTFEGIMTILKATEGGYKTDYQTLFRRISDGVLLDGDIRVTALHNRHLGQEEGPWQSFSFLIEAESKRIVYSGDVKDLDDIAPFLENGCDLLLMETGHHDPVTVCGRLKGGNVGRICFLHHGRRILSDCEGMLCACRKIFDDVHICNDGDVFDL
ncbi:MAG: MBL fold metallo-hydrolase [Clostridia bacterium]|nr:MBL fold metallo-hydrolase [Clostridia bacterium]